MSWNTYKRQSRMSRTQPAGFTIDRARYRISVNTAAGKLCGMSHGQVLALNARYFRVTGAIGFAYAFMPSPFLRLGLWAAALAAMSHYWRLVTRAERGGGLPIVGGARGRERDADSEQG